MSSYVISTNSKFCIHASDIEIMNKAGDQYMPLPIHSGGTGGSNIVDALENLNGQEHHKYLDDISSVVPLNNQIITYNNDKFTTSYVTNSNIENNAITHSKISSSALGIGLIGGFNEGTNTTAAISVDNTVVRTIGNYSLNGITQLATLKMGSSNAYSQMNQYYFASNDTNFNTIASIDTISNTCIYLTATILCTHKNNENTNVFEQIFISALIENINSQLTLSKNINKTQSHSSSFDLENIDIAFAGNKINIIAKSSVATLTKWSIQSTINVIAS